MSAWKTTLVDVLREVAERGEAVTYAELAERAGTPGPYRIHTLTLALEALIREDHAAGSPLRAAVAVSRARNGLPAPGFFQLCREIGRYFGPDDGPEAALFHRIERYRITESVGGTLEEPSD